MLRLADNQLRGTIPSALGQLANLRHLTLGGSNRLTGCTPDPLAEVPRSDLDRLRLPLCSADERSPDVAVLVALYHATDGANWTNNRNWLSEAPLDAWHGVTTDAEGRVTALQLENNQLRGSIPPALRSLASLQMLWLGYNQLSGELPPELGHLVNLTALQLHGNELRGAIPRELSRLAKLTRLWLFGNQFGGAIPPELSQLSSLEDLHLGENQLQGTIPPEFGRLTKLIRLGLYQNKLTGRYPPS